MSPSTLAKWARMGSQALLRDAPQKLLAVRRAAFSFVQVQKQADLHRLAPPGFVSMGKPIFQRSSLVGVRVQLIGDAG